MVDKFGHPAVILVVFLSVPEEDVIFVSGDNTCYDKRIC